MLIGSPLAYPNVASTAPTPAPGHAPNPTALQDVTDARRFFYRRHIDAEAQFARHRPLLAGRLSKSAAERAVGPKKQARVNRRVARQSAQSRPPPASAAPAPASSAPPMTPTASTTPATNRHDAAHLAVKRYLRATMGERLPKHILKNRAAIFNALHRDLRSADAASRAAEAPYSRIAQVGHDSAAMAHFLYYVGDETGVSRERIDTAHGLRMMRQTLRAIAETSAQPAPFTVAGYDFLDAGRQAQPVMTVRKEFIAHLRAAMPDLTHGTARWVADELLAEYEPLLERNDLPAAIRCGDLKWTDLQAGIATVAAMGIDPATHSHSELSALATTVDAAAHADQIAAEPDFLLPQVGAALRFADAAGHIDLRDMDTQGNVTQTIGIALDALDTARTALRRQELAPLLAAQKFLERPAPDRVEIARATLLGMGLEPAALGHAPAMSRSAIDPCTVDRSLLKFYLDGCSRGLHDALWKAGREPRDLPDLKQLYDREFNAYFDQFTQSAATLIAAAVDRLDADDYLFWNNNPAKLVQAVIHTEVQVPLAQGNFGPGPLFTHRNEKLPGGKALLFAVGDGGESRFYRVSLAQPDIVRRVPADSMGIDDFIVTHRDLFFDPDTLARIPAHPSALSYRRKTLASFEVGPAEDAGSRARAAADALNAPMRQLQHDRGYRITDTEQSVQAMQSFLLGLIPFYECASAIDQGRHDDAMVPCAIDAASAIPLLSNLAKGGKLLLQLSQKLPAAMSREIGTTVAQGLSRQALRSAARTAQSSLRGMGSRIAGRFGSDLLSLADPGFGMLHAFRNGLGRLLATQAAKRTSMLQILNGNRRTQALAALLAQRKRHTFWYDPQQDGWYLRKADGGAAGATAPESDPSLPADGPLVTCAGPARASQCIRFVRQNPRTQNTFGPYLTTLSDTPQRLRALPKLDAYYPSSPFDGAYGDGLEYTLPPGVEIFHLPFLSKQYEGLEIFEIDRRRYALDLNLPVPRLTLLQKQLHRRIGLCRTARQGGDQSCPLRIERIDAGRGAQAQYRVAFRQGWNKVAQYNRRAGKVDIRTEEMTISSKRSAAANGAPQPDLLLTPDASYSVQQNGEKLLVNPLDSAEAATQGMTQPALFDPTDPRSNAHFVAYDGTIGGDLNAVAFSIENGAHAFAYRVPFGTYEGRRGNPSHGMIRLGEEAYYRFKLPSAVTDAAPLALEPATPDHIRKYRRGQDKKINHWRREQARNRFRIELSDSQAGRLIRVFKEYRLEQYDLLVGQLAALPAQTRKTAVAALDDYIDGARENADMSTLGDVRQTVDRLLEDQLYRPESVSNFRDGLIAHFNRHRGSRDQEIRALSMETEDLDPALQGYASVYPSFQAALEQYEVLTGAMTKPDAADLRKLLSAGFQKAFELKNAAFAEIQIRSNGMLQQRKFYFSISGKAAVQTDAATSQNKMAAVPADTVHINANAAYMAHRRQAPGGGREPLLNLPNANPQGRPHDRNYDSEYMILTEIMRDHPNPDELISFKMVSRYIPCHSCSMGFTMFADHYRKTPMQFLYFSGGDRARRDVAGIAPVYARPAPPAMHRSALAAAAP